jgi:hypothetical protein
MIVINVIIHDARKSNTCEGRKLAGRVANGEPYENDGLCLWDYVRSYSWNVPWSVKRVNKKPSAAYLAMLALFVPIPRVLARYNQNAFSEAGQLVFGIVYDVMFGDALRFGRFKILEYSKDKVFNMAVLHIYIELLLRHNGCLLNWDTLKVSTCWLNWPKTNLDGLFDRVML